MVWVGTFLLIDLNEVKCLTWSYIVEFSIFLDACTFLKTKQITENGSVFLV